MRKIARAVAWLRANYAQSMNVEELAELVHMRPSSFHSHFRAVTSMSPLQYQKAPRLLQAQRLMVSARMDMGAAGREAEGDADDPIERRRAHQAWRGG